VNKRDFLELLDEKARPLYRDMPWRRDTRPYFVLVSELMLQQTQVDRVIPKFEAFTRRFPTVAELARAPLGDVLALWNGLGYNRRAKYLHDAAKMIVADFDSRFPDTVEELKKLPGVGPNTAGAIMAYAFNKPVVFVETNVRTVYFHHFFAGHDKVSDAQLSGVVANTMDTENPREFYWQLMDYGTWLKKQGAGSIRLSAHYVKQSPLKGSVREVRGQIIKALAAGDLRAEQLKRAVAVDERYEKALAGLINDGLVMQTGEFLHLTK
jgi:A/G-specific adenine glycosylase